MMLPFVVIYFIWWLLVTPFLLIDKTLFWMAQEFQGTSPIEVLREQCIFSYDNELTGVYRSLRCDMWERLLLSAVIYIGIYIMFRIKSSKQKTLLDNGPDLH